MYKAKDKLKYIKYKDSKVAYIEMEYGKNCVPHNCLCCNKQINEGSVVLFSNNCTYFPNFFAHSNCLKEYQNNIDELFSKIEGLWNTYKELRVFFERD